jgi:hypothetical protein
LSSFFSFCSNQSLFVRVCCLHKGRKTNSQKKRVSA